MHAYGLAELALLMLAATAIAGLILMAVGY